MKNLCKTLANVELVLGVIGSIFLAYTMGMRLDYRSLSLERDIGSTLVIFTSTMLCVATLYVILYAISEILENQERLIQKMNDQQVTSIKNSTPICSPPPKSSVHIVTSTAPVENSSKKIEQVVENVNNENWKVYNDWKCPSCKRINDGLIEICTCGTKGPSGNNADATNFWTCSNCGNANSIGIEICPGCGAIKD